MSRLKLFLHGGFLFLLLVASAATGDTGWYATRLATNPRTGLPARISVPHLKNADNLAAPVTLSLRQDGKEIPVLAVKRFAPDAYTIALSERGMKMELRYGTAGFPYLEWIVESKTSKTGNLSATFYLPLRPSADHAFFPAGERPRLTLDRGGIPSTYSYGDGPGIRTAMPLGQIYSSKEDWGLAFFGEFGEFVEDLSTTVVSRSEKNVLVAVTLSMPRPAMGRISRRLYFAATRGDWRPALGAVLARFPLAFEPHNPDVAHLHGPFVNSFGTPPDSNIEEWHAQGARVVEIHCTFPFYGEYVAQDKAWTVLVDDNWHELKGHSPLNQRPRDGAPWEEIKKYVEKQYPPQMTVAKVNDYIHRLHRHGMKGLIYFNPTEAWAPWAAVKFSSDRILTTAGKPAGAWYESVAMIPDMQRPWGKYLLEQIRGLLRIYPQVDGVFFDQADAGGHDLTELCAEACRLVRAQGKICWWNGPNTLERATLADGMMTEGGGSEAYRQTTEVIQYYGMAGKPIVSLGPLADSGYAEMLVHGVIPRPVSKLQHETTERWFPLFTWLHNRRWVLEVHALDTTPGVQANLFRIPDGNLVVPIVPEPIPTDKSGWLFDIGVTIRVSDAAEVRGVYFLAPDLLGYHKLPFVREGNTLRIFLPRLGPAGLLVLAKTGVFPALEGRLNLVQGRAETLRWVVDNWTAQSRKVSLRIDRPLTPKYVSGQVAAGASMKLEVPVKIPAGSKESRMQITASAMIEGDEKAGKAELWIDAPLLLAVEGPTRVRDDEAYPLVVKLLGQLPTVTTVNLKFVSSAWQFESAIEEVILKPGAPAVVKLWARPLGVGETLISITASDGHQALTNIEFPVEVLATAMSPNALGSVRFAELLFDVFGVDGGDYAHKPVSLNGIVLGDLPSGYGDQWISDKSMPLTPEAIMALRPHNEINIDNQVGDSFKVRNFRLVLHMRGGATVISTADASVYTGGAGWLHDEGKQFLSSLTGIAVDILFDPNRPEKYDKEIFGVPRAARLILETNGSDGGIYAHKVVSINDQPIGELPASVDWNRQSMMLTAEALRTLSSVNVVVIENSVPADTFKVRRARLEVENTEGRKYVSETEEEAYTSMGWEYEEGKIGSPIRFTLRFLKKPE